LKQMRISADKSGWQKEELHQGEPFWLKLCIFKLTQIHLKSKIKNFLKKIPSEVLATSCSKRLLN